ncbi:hypothetical protein [Halorarius litoreus]|uniref:hypothetical protein n=1 Tax=Halorarius litoreus TaxID=2962676 RepID=UPI0020CE0FD8|nr:hypothetical protein [Halorarius litoreus]
MALRLRRAVLLTLYQLSLITGVLLLPLALVARRVGVTVPFDRIIQRLDAALDDTK